MSIYATGTFETKTWDEKTYDEIEGGGKLTRVRVTNSFRGDVQAESTLEYLMVYPDEKTASFVGLERIVGRIGDRSGSFVLQQSGTWEGGVVKCAWFVVPGSGTGDLRGLRGQGGFVWDGQHGQPTPFTLDYDFE